MHAFARGWSHRAVVRILGCCALLLGLVAPANSQPADANSAPSFEMGLDFANQSQYLSVPLAPHPLGAQQLPATIRLDGQFPAPGDQGAQASCVGWATAYGLSSYMENQRFHWGLQSQDHLFSPAYIYNKIRSQMAGCTQGTSYLDALRVLTNEGVASLADFPYNAGSCSAVPDSQVNQKALLHRASNWRRVNVQDPMEVKSQLAAGYPVLIAMWVDQGFQALRGPSVYQAPMGARLGGHAMVVVGYAASLSAYRVITSWGSVWGDNGYGWIGYGAFTQLVVEGYLVLPGAPPSPTPTPPNPPPAPGPGPTPGLAPAPNPPPVPIQAPSAVVSGALVNPVGNAVVGLLGLAVPASGSVDHALGLMAHLVGVVSVFRPGVVWVPIFSPP